MRIVRALPTCPIVLVLIWSSATAAEFEIGPSDNLIASANALQPGDVLVLQGGTYGVSTLFNLTISGTALQPIVIRAKAGEAPLVHQSNAGQNIVNIIATHLVIDGIRFSGGSRGVRLQNVSDFTFSNNEIFDTADAALTANDAGVTYSRLLIERNHIHDTGNTGEGMYLGCNQDNCRVADSTISWNWVHHTNAMDVIQGDGIELKDGSHDNRITDNVIHDTSYPCITTYSVNGNGGVNRIERNAMWNCGDRGIQTAADAVIRNNIVLFAVSDGIAAQPTGATSPGNLLIAHNTVVQTTGNALRLNNVAGSVGVHNNALYSQSGFAIRATGTLTELALTGNVGAGSLMGVSAGFNPAGNPALDFVDFGYADASPGDVYPAVGSLLNGAADTAQLAADDFNLVPRAADATVGAYASGVAGNPGWALMAGFKQGVAVQFADGFEALTP